MMIDMAVAVVLQVGLCLLFGRFVAPRWKILGKLVFFFAIAITLSLWVGHWSLLWIIGHPALGVGGHVYWCRKHGIDWLTCEPRDRYLELRPWAAADGFGSRTE